MRCRGCRNEVKLIEAVHVGNGVMKFNCKACGKAWAEPVWWSLSNNHLFEQEAKWAGR